MDRADPVYYNPANPSDPGRKKVSPPGCYNADQAASRTWIDPERVPPPARIRRRLNAGPASQTPAQH